MDAVKTSPATAADLASLVRLNGTLAIGKKQLDALVEAFGSVEAPFRQSLASLQGVPGIGPKTAEKILDPAGEEEASRQIDQAKELGFAILPHGDPRYPERLRTIHNPPILLYVWGDPGALDAPLAFGIVGSRRGSVYGKLQANRFARELAELGFTVVSGLARGVDGAAHAGAVAAGGKTVAFLGSGLDRIYPPEHKKLASEIAQKRGGAVASEFPIGTRPFGPNFPRRNRLISGASLGVLVIEATEKSGALSTASHANEQGREVFALPGRIDSPTSRGTNRLIRDGARLVECVEDILEELSPEARGVLAKSRPGASAAGGGLTPEEEQVLEAVPREGAHADEIVLAAGLPTATVMSALTTLELKKRLKRLAGMSFAKL